MKITCTDIGKKYQGQWIFSNINFDFVEKSKTAIIGFNGSGKSTLLSILSGYTSPNKGEIKHYIGNGEITKEELFNHLSIGSPYLDVPEELNPAELIKTFSSFKPFIEGLNEIQILERLRLSKEAEKPIKYFSSGMKQRLKIGLAILSDTPLLLLDEPLSNLDKEGSQWFGELMQQYINNKTVVIASNNIEDEIKYCTSIIDISKYKKS
ncbi:MAG: ATP-binding cassette domain-containing protein [Bacteroidota bacterium]|jgi:ABC-type multidrug transport system ATPase subunit